MGKKSGPFWKIKSLDKMTHEEWELLCDGCGRCCLHKFEDGKTGKIYYTSVACRLLDVETCRCRDYHNRVRLVHDCLVLKPEKAAEYKWLPGTCAYRRLAEGKGLKWWHPLISGDPETIHQSGVSVRDKVVSEKYINTDDLEAYVLVGEL